MKVSIFQVVIIAERSNYAYLSILKNRSMNIGVLLIKLNVIKKHLFTLLIAGKTSLNDRIDF